MPYTRNFGMRSFENIVRTARFRVPTTGPAFLIGTGVVIDPANPGFMKRPTAGEAPSPACGVVVYEHIQHKGLDPFLSTADDYETVPLGQYAQIVRGPGVKVWFKNTATKPLYDGREIAGRELVDGTGATPTVAVGDFLKVKADGTFEKGNANGSDGWFLVEQVDGDLVECRFTF